MDMKKIKPKYGIVISVITSTTFSPFLFKGHLNSIIPQISRMGFSGIELGGLRDPKNINIRETVKILEKNNIIVLTSGTAQPYFDHGLSFSNPDRKIRKDTIEKVKEIILLSRDLNSSVMLSLILGTISNYRDQKDYNKRLVSAKRRIMECLYECLCFSEKYNTFFLIEPLNRYETNIFNTLEDVNNFLELNKKVLDTNRIGILADTFHMNIEEDLIDKNLEKYLGLIKHIHFSDSNRRAPGYGHLDFKSIANVLINNKYEGYISFEVLPQPSPDIAANKCIEYTKSLFE